MTRYSVQRFRAAVLHMYLRMAVIITLPLVLLNFLIIATPDKGLVLSGCAVFTFWLKWRTRRHSDDSLRYATGW